MDADKTYREKARRKLHENAKCYFDQIQEATFRKNIAVRPPTFYLKNHPNKTDKTGGIPLEK